MTEAKTMHEAVGEFGARPNHPQSHFPRAQVLEAILAGGVVCVDVYRVSDPHGTCSQQPDQQTHGKAVDTCASS
jgi:hypothetical protein